MHSTTLRVRQFREPAPEQIGPCSVPKFCAHETPQRLFITVFLPEVDPHSLTVGISGRTLVVTGNRKQPIRPNWQSFQLERARPNYRLSLPLPKGLDLDSVRGIQRRDFLTLMLPKLRHGRPPHRAAA